MVRFLILIGIVAAMIVPASVSGDNSGSRVIPISTSQSQENTIQTKILENQELGLSFDYPADWQPQIDEEGDSPSVLFFPKGSQSVIEVEAFDTPVTVEQLAKAMIDGHSINKEEYKNFKLLDTMPNSEIGNNNFYAISMSFESDAGKQVNGIWSTKVGDTLYAFHMRSMLEDVKGMSAVIGNMLKTAELSGISYSGGGFAGSGQEQQTLTYQLQGDWTAEWNSDSGILKDEVYIRQTGNEISAEYARPPIYTDCDGKPIPISYIYFEGIIIYDSKVKGTSWECQGGVKTTIPLELEIQESGNKLVGNEFIFTKRSP